MPWLEKACGQRTLSCVALLATLGCSRAPALPGGKQPAIDGFGRPPGMPIGTEGDVDGAPPASDDEALVSQFDDEAPVALKAQRLELIEGEASPCTGCVELDVYVNDINQRDEFAFELGVRGLRLTRVVWTLLVTFNSDQLAVQPFADKQVGKYTKLHVENFPLGKAVEVAQDVEGKVRRLGLFVGSSGAWTGDRVMRVYVANMRAEGPDGFERTFENDAGGLAARTDNRQPEVVIHAD